MLKLNKDVALHENRDANIRHCKESANVRHCKELVVGSPPRSLYEVRDGPGGCSATDYYLQNKFQNWEGAGYAGYAEHDNAHH